MRWATNLIPFGSTPDRFSPGGYRPALDLRGRVAAAARVAGLSGVELHYPDMFEEQGINGVRRILEEHNLACAVVSPIVSTAAWRYGALTNPDPALRRQAIQRVLEAVDVAEALGAGQVNLWLGQDGFDYPFQADYRGMWIRLAEGVAEVAGYNPRVRICLEYKQKEPRAFIALGNVGKVLYLTQLVGLPNVGGLLDVGHALMARELPAESAVLLHQAGKLFHLHFNDTYGDWDWDLVAGSVHLLETVELLWWLDALGYEGWFSLDLFPQREDPVWACARSIAVVEALAEVAREVGREGLMVAWRNGAAEAALEIVQRSMICLGRDLRE